MPQEQQQKRPRDLGLQSQLAYCHREAPLSIMELSGKAERYTADTSRRWLESGCLRCTEVGFLAPSHAPRTAFFLNGSKTQINNSAWSFCNEKLSCNSAKKLFQVL